MTRFSSEQTTQVHVHGSGPDHPRDSDGSRDVWRVNGEEEEGEENGERFDVWEAGCHHGGGGDW